MVRHRMLWTLQPGQPGGSWLPGIGRPRWLNGVLGCYHFARRAALDPGSGEPLARSANEPRPSTRDRQAVGWPFELGRERPGCPSRGQPGHGEFTGEPAAPACPPRPEDGYTGAFEVICGDCGDYPELGYSQVPRRLQRLRGPYNTIEAGLAACQERLGLAN